MRCIPIHHCVVILQATSRVLTLCLASYDNNALEFTAGSECKRASTIDY